MTSYQYRKSHYRDKTVLRPSPSYLHNGISYTDKTTSLYWIGALVLIHAIACSLFDAKPQLFPTQRGLLSIAPLGMTLIEVLMQKSNIFIETNEFESSVSKFSAILFRSNCITLRHINRFPLYTIFISAVISQRKSLSFITSSRIG